MSAGASMRVTVICLSGLMASITAVNAAGANNGTMQPNVGAKMTTCDDELSVLRVALSKIARPGDVIRENAIAIPTVAEEGATGQPALVPLTEASAFWRIGWRGEAPSSKLVHRWYSEVGRTLEPCFESRGGDRRVASLLGSLPAGKFERSTRNDNQASGDFTISRPTFEGQYALVLFSLAEKGLGGQTELVLLIRDGNGWREVGSRILAEA